MVALSGVQKRGGKEPTGDGLRVGVDSPKAAVLGEWTPIRTGRGMSFVNPIVDEGNARPTNGSAGDPKPVGPWTQLERHP